VITKPEVRRPPPLGTKCTRTANIKMSRIVTTTWCQ